MFKHFKIVKRSRQEWIDHALRTQDNPSGQDFDIALELSNKYHYNKEVFDECHRIKFDTLCKMQDKLNRIKFTIICLRYKKIDKILEKFSKNA